MCSGVCDDQRGVVSEPDEKGFNQKTIPEVCFTYCGTVCGLVVILPVSYTHLDVYKRQSKDTATILSEDIQRLLSEMEAEEKEREEAVGGTTESLARLSESMKDQTEEETETETEPDESVEEESPEDEYAEEEHDEDEYAEEAVSYTHLNPV